MLEPFVDHLVGRRIRQRGVEDLGVGIVGGDLDRGKRDQRQFGGDAQVFEVETQQIRQFAADLLRYPVGTGIAMPRATLGRHADQPSVRAIS